MNPSPLHDDGSDSDDLQALFDSVAAGASAVPAAPPPSPDVGGDSDDLQALFDSVAASTPTAVSAAPAAVPTPTAEGDSDDLQDLFDQVSQQAAAGATAIPETQAIDGAAQEVVFNRLGQLARQLHDSLRGLGMDRLIEESARQIPDARDRLAYIAQMTEQAASRVLNATDIAKPVQDELIARSSKLSERWEQMFANRLSPEEFKLLAMDTRGYFADAPGRLRLTNDQLMEIILAQDFQDLTGQVIKKIVELVQGLESQLLTVLLESMPEERKVDTHRGLLNGPVVSAEGRRDVVTDQSQVDDLLESLGF